MNVSVGITKLVDHHALHVYDFEIIIVCVHINLYMWLHCVVHMLHM